MNINEKKTLSPLFKWTGGKRREIKYFISHLPEYVKNGDKYNYVEPFVGGGALFFHLNNTKGRNIINDFDSSVTNFYNCVKEQNKEFINFTKEASGLFTPDGDYNEQSELYYKWRNLDRDNDLINLTPGELAARFYIVNQLSFSGMRRFNSKGEFNVPFGHYKSLNSDLLTSSDHIKLLNRTKVMNGDFRQALVGHDKPNTFIFLDPPYTRVMKTYSHDNVFNDKEQVRLRNRMITIKKAQWLMIIDDSPLTRKLYKDYIAGEYDINYGVNIKNRVDNSAKHLIIKNY